MRSTLDTTLERVRKTTTFYAPALSGAREGTVPKYYDITLKNARGFEAHEVRVNGLPLSGLHMIGGPGRLQFIARPAVKPGATAGLGNFKSMSGIDAELEIAEYGLPRRRRRLRGRVTSAIARPGGAGQMNQTYEEVTFVYHQVT